MEQLLDITQMFSLCMIMFLATFLFSDWIELLDDKGNQ